MTSNEPNQDTSVLIVDDDPDICEVISAYLNRHGMQTTIARSAAEARACLADEHFDLMILDMQLPDGNGIDIAAEIKSDRNIGIIVLTGSGEQIDRIVSLEVGADDYLEKPCDLRELLARCRSLLRRLRQTTANHDVQPDDRIKETFSGWTLDVTKRQLTDPEGKDVSLTTQEFDLLTVLVRNRDRVLTRDNIMDQMKGRDWNPFDRSIDNTVSRLRKRLGDDGQSASVIRTVRGVGYLFTGEID